MGYFPPPMLFQLSCFAMFPFPGDRVLIYNELTFKWMFLPFQLDFHSERMKSLLSQEFSTGAPGILHRGQWRPDEEVKREEMNCLSTSDYPAQSISSPAVTDPCAIFYQTVMAITGILF